MGNCHPSKTNVNLSFASVNIGFLGWTISHVTLSCSQYLYMSISVTDHTGGVPDALESKVQSTISHLHQHFLDRLAVVFRINSLCHPKLLTWVE